MVQEVGFKDLLDYKVHKVQRKVFKDRKARMDLLVHQVDHQDLLVQWDPQERKV
jgi:hypothetical protein